MIVHLLDGTYELFRQFYGRRRFTKGEDQRFGAVVGVLHSVLEMIEEGATHVGVATDHVIESFRNRLWPGYKTGDGIEPALRAQFQPLEEALEAMGVTVWPMVELEADDALASAAARAAATAEVDRVYICTPDKDLSQCVEGERVVQLSRRTRVVLDEAGVTAKFGVPPASIPDYLALVGDSADGYPGLPGWGARSTAAVLTRWGHFEQFPAECAAWNVDIRWVGQLCRTFHLERERAYLFRDLATLRSEERLFDSVEALRWRGPRPTFEEVARGLEAPALA